MTKRSIFVYLLYIITIYLVSIIFIIFSANAEQTDTKEPFDIWAEDSLVPINENDTEEDVKIDENTESKSAVKESDFSYSRKDSLGLIDISNGGFDTTLWNGSSYSDIEYLINSLPEVSYSSTLRELLVNSLLTIATPPKYNLESTQSYLDLKINFLASKGYFEEIYLLSTLMNEDEINEQILGNIEKYFLISGNYKRICNRDVTYFSDYFNDLYYTSFCNAMNSNLLALDLNISLMREETKHEKEYIELLISLLNDELTNTNEIGDISLIKLNLLKNEKINYDNLIKEDADIEYKLFYVLSSQDSNLKKINITETLLELGLLDVSYLADFYKDYKFDNDNEKNITLENRISIYQEIRKTASQEKIVKLIPKFIDIFSKQGFLNKASTLIYDKVKVITPKQNLVAESLDVCLILILNKDLDKCKEWLNVINYKDDYKILMAKIKFYLFLNSDISFSLDELEILLEDKKLSSKQKNIIVKYYELMTDEKISNYWKTPNDLNRVSSVITNVKLDEYLKSLDNQVGEMILLLNLIHGDQKFINLHETTIFTIIEGLINIDPVYANQYVFEYLTKDTL